MEGSTSSRRPPRLPLPDRERARGASVEPGARAGVRHADADFDLGVRHLQMLGVRYFMVWTPEMQKLADASTATQARQGHPAEPADRRAAARHGLKDWKIYEVANSDLVVGLDREPVVAHRAAERSADVLEVLGPTVGPASGAEPRMQDGWECAAAPWWMNRDRARQGVTRSRARSSGSTSTCERPRDTRSRAAVTPTQVSNVHETVDKISFHVSDDRQAGRGASSRTSRTGRCTARTVRTALAPNLMVVVPTSKTCSSRYGLTAVDWAGRVSTVAGIVLPRAVTGACAARCRGGPTTSRRGERRRSTTSDDRRTTGDPARRRTIRR